ncbi:MAG: phosphotransferase [Chloroflexota bacterium]
MSHASSCNRKPCTCRRRVLIVDNDPIYRNMHQINVEKWGLYPIIAEGRGDELLENAVALAYQYRCHVAIVDMRLRDDDDRNDRSGLELVSRLGPTRAIIVTAYGDRQTTREALREQKAWDMIGKEEGPQELHERIQSALGDMCNDYIHIQWPDGVNVDTNEMDEIIGRLAIKDAHADTRDKAVNGKLNWSRIMYEQAQLLLYRLYTDVEQSSSARVTEIQLELIDDGSRSSSYARSQQKTTTRSIVFIAHAKSVDGFWQVPNIVKFTSVDNVENETYAYYQYAHRLLSSDHRTHIQDSSDVQTLWDLGAIRYTNLGMNDRRLLSHCFEDFAYPTERLCEAVTSLFIKTLRNWYQAPSSLSSLVLYDHYRDMLPKLERLDTYQQKGERIQLDSLPFALPNPVRWAKEHRHQSRFTTRWDVPTHGDLHLGNVFVDSFEQTRLIDFERTGPGHVLRDFTELEVSTLLRFLSFAPEEFPLAVKLGIALLQPDSFIEPMPEINLTKPTTPELLQRIERVYRIIGHLRMLIPQVTDVQNIEEYYWALFMETLHSVLRNYTKWTDQAEAQRAEAWSMLMAAMLCERLDCLYADRPWPPSAWLGTIDR